MARIAIKDERELPLPSRQASARFDVETDGPGFTDVTAAIEAWIDRQGFADGLLTVFVRHTSASLTIQENADPDVRADLTDAFRRLAPENAPWRHTTEGPDDMPAHVKSALTDTSIAIPIVNGRPSFGTWQSLYLIEHRARPHRRTVHTHYIGS